MYCIYNNTTLHGNIARFLEHFPLVFTVSFHPDCLSAFLSLFFTLSYSFSISREFVCGARIVSFDACQLILCLSCGFEKKSLINANQWEWIKIAHLITGVFACVCLCVFVSVPVCVCLWNEERGKEKGGTSSKWTDISKNKKFHPSIC